jgi:hypothetical protein
MFSKRNKGCDMIEPPIIEHKPTQHFPTFFQSLTKLNNLFIIRNINWKTTNVFKTPKAKAQGRKHKN